MWEEKFEIVGKGQWGNGQAVTIFPVSAIEDMVKNQEQTCLEACIYKPEINTGHLYRQQVSEIQHTGGFQGIARKWLQGMSKAMV